jgi:hypothetical protein
MEGLTRAGSDGTCITDGIVQMIQFHAANDAATPCLNILVPRRIVYSSACNWNLIMTADNHPYNG